MDSRSNDGRDRRNYEQRADRAGGRKQNWGSKGRGRSGGGSWGNSSKSERSNYSSGRSFGGKKRFDRDHKQGRPYGKFDNRWDDRNFEDRSESRDRKRFDSRDEGSNWNRKGSEDRNRRISWNDRRDGDNRNGHSWGGDREDNAVGTRTDPPTNAISAATITRDESVISITAGATQKIVTIVVLTVASVAMIVLGLGTSPGISIASLGEISETIVTTIGEMARVAKSVGTTTVMIVAGTIGAVKIAGKSVRTGSQENVVGMTDVRTVALTGMMIDAARSVGMIDVTIKAAKSAGAISETTSEVKSAGAIAAVSRIMTETLVAMTGQITVRGIASPVNSIVVTKTGDRVKTVTRSSEITGASVKFATSV